MSDASFAQQPVQPPRQQSAVRSNLVSGISPPGIPAASPQSTSTTISSQTMVPPVQTGFNTSGIVSSAPIRPPHFNSIAPPTRNIQVGSEIRAPAPHLQPYRPPTPPSAVIAPLRGMLSQQAPCNIPTTSAPPCAMSSQKTPNNIPTTSASLPQLIPRSTVPTYLSEPRNLVHLPENARGLHVHNVSAVGLRADTNSQYGIHITNVRQRMLDVAVLNPSQLNVSSSMQATSGDQSTSPDVVYLSDDD